MRIQYSPAGWWVIGDGGERGPYAGATAMQVAAALAAIAARDGRDAAVTLVQADGSERACHLGVRTLQPCGACGTGLTACPLLTDARHGAVPPR